MKKLHTKSFVTVLLLLLGLSTHPKVAQSQETTGSEIPQAIRTVAEEIHYNPPVNDSILADRIAHLLVEQIDPANILLTQDEVDRIHKLNREIQDVFNGKSNQGLVILSDIYKNSLRRTDSCLTTLENQRLDFSTSDTLHINYSRESLSEIDIFNTWRKRLKLYALEQWIDSDKTTDISELADQALNHFKCRTDSKHQNSKEIFLFIQECFLKSMASAYDPHTSFMSEDEISLLERMLSSSDLTFGIYPNMNINGDIIVAGVMPGSSAWQSGQISEGDVILSIDHKTETFKFDCISLEEAYYLINKSEFKQLTFHIRKLDGQKAEVSLTKTAMKVDNNRINSFILNGDHKIGYIYLPSFYSETDSYQYLPNGCANDLAKELIRLKKEGIEGLIIDLRNNGGGSMLEAVRMAGIFIDYGALGVSRDNVSMEIMKDLARGTIYNGPLTVMLNSYSASASELFAAAMQDYNRAVVTGTRSYGKATSQIIIPVNMTPKPEGDSIVSSGYLKITSGKFYRVTGKTHQLEGVHPDITIYRKGEEHAADESQQMYALTADSVDKKTYYKALPVLPKDSLRELSNIRLQNSDFLNFKASDIETNNELTIVLDSTDYKPIGSYLNFQTDTARAPTKVFTVKNPEYIQGMSSVNQEGEINHELINSISKDPLIIENYQITNDLINITKE